MKRNVALLLSAVLIVSIAVGVFVFTGRLPSSSQANSKTYTVQKINMTTPEFGNALYYDPTSLMLIVVFNTTRTYEFTMIRQGGYYTNMTSNPLTIRSGQLTFVVVDYNPCRNDQGSVNYGTYITFESPQGSLTASYTCVVPPHTQTLTVTNPTLVDRNTGNIS